MTPAAFTVRTTSGFPTSCIKAIAILKQPKRARLLFFLNPHNRTRRHRIKKLEGVAPGEGQYWLSLGRLRFRYDIVGQLVWLHYCGLRREDTY